MTLNHLVLAIVTKGTISTFEVIKGHGESDIKYPKFPIISGKKDQKVYTLESIAMDLFPQTM